MPDWFNLKNAKIALSSGAMWGTGIAASFAVTGDISNAVIFYGCSVALSACQYVCEAIIEQRERESEETDPIKKAVSSEACRNLLTNRKSKERYVNGLNTLGVVVGAMTTYAADSAVRNYSEELSKSPDPQNALALALPTVPVFVFSSVSTALSMATMCKKEALQDDKDKYIEEWRRSVPGAAPSSRA